MKFVLKGGTLYAWELDMDVAGTYSGFGLLKNWTLTPKNVVSFLFGFLLLTGEMATATSRCEKVLETTPSFLNLSLIPMREEYRGEDQGLYLDPVTRTPWRVRYFKEEEKIQFELILKDGLFTYRGGRKVQSQLDAESASFVTGILVIDRAHRFLYLPYARGGFYHHSSLSAGEPVLFAGMASFDEGRLRELSNSSGHYKTSTDQTLDVLRVLQAQGVDMSRMKLTDRVAMEVSGSPVMTPEEVKSYLKRHPR
ncbi:MAG: hypothetical protein AAGB31_14780 [Bdellovibrio sp.]